MQRAVFAAVVVTGCILGASVCHARTEPIAGAVSLPDAAGLLLPFPGGARVRVSAGYGPNGGSSLHDNTNVAGSGNDYYALDLVYADEPDGGRGLAVVAAWPGEVVLAGWSSAGWVNFGIRVILRHDLGDGHVYYTLYAHLNALREGLEEGDLVEQGEELGELGRSCQQALECGSFSGPHVHFSVHRDSMIGGSGTGGSYGGNAVVPEPLDGADDIVRGAIIVSRNDGRPPECGDSRCNGDETHDDCPGDCPVCEEVPAMGRIIDEQDRCFETGGDPQYLRRVSDAGYDDSLVWTHAIDGEADNFGIWQLDFAEAGDYRLDAYTDAAYAQSQQARYIVDHGGSSETVVLDQSAADGWQPLGDFAFAAGAGQRVRLDDATGEAFELRRQLVFDALALTRLDAPEPRDAAIEGVDSTTFDSTTEDADTSPDAAPADAAPADAAPEHPDADRGRVRQPDAVDAGGDAAAGDGGGCQQGPRTPLVGVLVLLGLRLRLRLRRRR